MGLSSAASDLTRKVTRFLFLHFWIEYVNDFIFKDDKILENVIPHFILFREIGVWTSVEKARKSLQGFFNAATPSLNLDYISSIVATSNFLEELCKYFKLGVILE